MSSNSLILIIVIILVIIVIAGIWLFSSVNNPVINDNLNVNGLNENNNFNDNENLNDNINQNINLNANVNGNINADNNQSSVKNITVAATNFVFTPSTITVNQNDIVRLTLRVQQGTHAITVEGYNINSSTMDEGEEETIQFVASNKGEFTFYCPIGNHRALGMTGNLTVQ